MYFSKDFCAMQHVATAFQMMDLDDSGFIDFEEFQRVCTSIRSPSRPSKFLRTGMKLQSECVHSPGSAVLECTVAPARDWNV